jgi:hypothetical protein
MTEKQIFTDAASVGKILGIVSGLLVLIAVCWFVVAGTALGMAVNLGVLGGLFLLTALMVLLAYNLSTHRTVACDSTGCEVTTGSKWGKSQSDSFKWHEVTGTGVAKQVISTGKGRQTVFYFGVGVEGREILLLRSGTKDFADLMSVVNERTPHLPYVWVGSREIDNRQVMQEVANSYYKVARS